MLHLGGIDLISCKCLAIGSIMFLIVGMSISFTRPSNNGFEAIKFILYRLAIETKILCSRAELATPGGVYSYQGSTKASGIITLIGT